MKPIPIIENLFAINDKHSDFFFENNKTVFDYVYINWDEPLNISLINTNLPAHIKTEIELAIQTNS